MEDWISVEDRLPREDYKYLIHAESADPGKPLIQVIWYDPEFGWSGLPLSWIEAITHWMPLPGPPKE